MKDPVILIGVGEMGGVFARGLLRAGHPIMPVTRDMNVSILSKTIPSPEAVLVAVGEKDLDKVLSNLPDAWQGSVILLQNELLPHNWKDHDIHGPTVISVWFEKKPGQDFKVIVPSPVYGPESEMIQEALGKINIPVKICKSADELLFELVLKNLYILTTNICGLKTQGTVEDLWKNHESLARSVANEVLDIQFQLAGKDFDREELIQSMVKTFEGDWNHKCMGRSAPARLERAIHQAEELNIELNVLKDIAAEAAVS